MDRAAAIVNGIVWLGNSGATSWVVIVGVGAGVAVGGTVGAMVGAFVGAGVV